MMKTFCIDVSGSMSVGQMISAMTKVMIEWKEKDAVLIFDHAEAEYISFEDVVNYACRMKDIEEARMLLFKKGTHNKWSGSGAFKASVQAFYYSEKVCLTDAFLLPHELKKFHRIIKVDHDD